MQIVAIIQHTHTQHIYIMFAATQQIASVAGLKATKVQVRDTTRALFLFFDVVVVFVLWVRRAPAISTDLPLAR